MITTRIPQDDLVQKIEKNCSYLRVDPANKLLLTRAVELNLAAAQAEAALPHAVHAAALFPDDSMIQCLLGHVFTAQHQWEKAAAIYAAVLKITSNADLAFSLANCQVWMGQHQAAIDTMAPFLGRADLPAATITLLVRAHHHTGDYEAAKALIEQNHARLAQDPDFLAAASLIYLDAAEFDKAASFGDAALALGARPIEALVTHATLSLGHAEADRAIKQFDEALAINPDEGRSWAGSGQAYLLKQDFAKAKEKLERAVLLLPNSIGTWHALGWSHVFTKELPLADLAFRKALSIDRTFAETHGSIAAVDALQGKRAEAEEGIERALRLDPTCLSARFAQMVLGGETADPERFKALSMRFIAGRQNSFGTPLSDMINRQLDQQ